MLGILPRKYTTATNQYTNHIDIWALGAIVHQMLTSEIPFLDTFKPQESDTDFGGSSSQSSTVDSSVDYDLLIDYCRGLIPFPSESLTTNGAGKQAVDFVMSLMVANPSGRGSATNALKHEWFELSKAPITKSAGPSPTASLVAHDTTVKTGTSDEDVWSPEGLAWPQQQIHLDEGPVVTIGFSIPPSTLAIQDSRELGSQSPSTAKGLRFLSQISAPVLQPVLLIACVYPFASLCIQQLIPVIRLIGRPGCGKSTVSHANIPCTGTIRLTTYPLAVCQPVQSEERYHQH